jgi:hypothetical protein
VPGKDSRDCLGVGSAAKTDSTLDVERQFQNKGAIPNNAINKGEAEAMEHEEETPRTSGTGRRIDSFLTHGRRRREEKETKKDHHRDGSGPDYQEVWQHSFRLLCAVWRAVSHAGRGDSRRRRQSAGYSPLGGRRNDSLHENPGRSTAYLP